MALFKCSRCMQIYEDYYPPDDTCIKCNRGTVRILKTWQKVLSTELVDKHALSVDKFQNCNVISNAFSDCITNKQSL